MDTFQINALIWFWRSICFKPHGFIIRNTVCTCSFCTLRFLCIDV